MCLSAAAHNGNLPDLSGGRLGSRGLQFVLAGSSAWSRSAAAASRSREISTSRGAPGSGSRGPGPWPPAGPSACRSTVRRRPAGRPAGSGSRQDEVQAVAAGLGIRYRSTRSSPPRRRNRVAQAPDQRHGERAPPALSASPVRPWTSSARYWIVCAGPSCHRGGRRWPSGPRPRVAGPAGRGEGGGTHGFGEDRGRQRGRNLGPGVCGEYRRCAWVRFDSGRKMLPFDKSGAPARRPPAVRAPGRVTSATLSPRSCATITAASAPSTSAR